MIYFTCSNCKSYLSVWLFVLQLSLFSIASAQEVPAVLIAGRVADSSGAALVGVRVHSKLKPQLGTATDSKGYYKLNVRKDDILVFSHVGFQSVERKVGSSSSIDVVLSANTEQLDEVLINVPYGVAKKSTYTGSVGYIDGATIQRSQVSSVSKALQGTVAGLQSFSSSGQPGSDATIRLRGIGSVNASSAPLYVVDGVPYSGALSSIASADIESISVLKDATAATLYGSRAANGVIMITTKQGNKAAPIVDVTSKFGFSDRARRDYDQLSTNDYFELLWEAVRNNRLDNGLQAEAAAAYASTNLAGLVGINPYGSNHPQPVGTDGKLKSGLQPLWDDNWTDALSQKAHYTDINLNVNGGSSTSRYYISAGYLNDQGVAIESGFKRYSLRANVSSNIKKWLEVGINVSGTHSIQDYPKQDDSNTANVILVSRAIPSFYPVYERDRETGAYLEDKLTGGRIFDYGAYRATSFAKSNLLGSMPHDLSRTKRDAATVRGYLQIQPMADLTFRSSVNIDYDSRFAHNYSNPEFGPGVDYGGSVSKSNVRSTNLTFNNVINYAKEINGLHKFKALAGQEYYEYNTSQFGGARSKVIADGFFEPDVAAILTDFYGNSDQYKLLSFFGNGEYSFNDRYYFSASARSDGSSRFYPKRWGTFWSLGGSWRLINEDFLNAWKTKGLNNLTIRASYGAQGNDNIGYYAYQALYAINTMLGEPALRASRLATPDLSWETNLNSNIGLDFGLWKNRLNGSVEYFVRRSKDLLFSKELVPSSGFSSTNQNIGAVKNYGWEFTITGYPLMKEDWKWKLSLNATTYKNKITALPKTEMWSGNKKWVEGGSLYDFYLIEWAGINRENGQPQWYRWDAQGNKVVTEDYSAVKQSDRIKSGTSLPDLSGGFQSALTYKNIELSALFSYVIGGKIYNGDQLTLYHQGSPGAAWSADMLNRWTPEKPDTDFPRLSTQPKSSWTNSSTRFLVDRSFLRLKTVTLSYGLPKRLLAQAGIQRANLFLQGENLLTFTKEQGLDPEQTFDGATYFRYPTMRTFSFGVNIVL